MSCNTTTDDVRIIMKYSTISGATPSIPLSDNHEDGTWLPTDLYIGEFFTNAADDTFWIRTDNGINQLFGGTGGSASFIGDFVHISGGTYSGEVFAPTFSANYLIGSIISGGTISSDYFIGTYSGDGSLLTGIVADWLGGTISNASYFTNTVDFTNDVSFDGLIQTNNTEFLFDNNINVNGYASASIFYGDGSGLTNLPTGTYSDTFTIGATLSSNTIIFSRNDGGDYDIDLSSILNQQAITTITWDDTIDELLVTFNDASTISLTIDNFSQVSSTGPITAPEFYGGIFYGEFVGTFSNDIYTTGATLSGTTAIFDRTDGVTYSLDLSSIAGGGTGSAGTLEQTLVLGNTTGTQSIFISSSASQIQGYNGINQHWYDAGAPYVVLGDYYQIENNTGGGETQSYIRFYDEGDTLIENNEKYDTINSPANQDAKKTKLFIRPQAIIFEANNQDFDTNTLHLESQTAIEASAFTHETSDILNDCTAQIVASTDGTGTFTAVQLQAYHYGGASASKLIVAHDYISNRVDASIGTGTGPFTLIEQTYTGIIVSGTPSFPGVTYDRDYSANFTNRSLVDKEYVDNASVSFTYITENTTTGTLTMSAPTSITSTVTDGTIINEDYNGLDYSRKSYDDGLYTTELIFDPLGNWDQTLFGEKYTGGGTQGSIRFGSGGQGIDITTTDGLVVTLATQYNLGTTNDIVTTATDITDTTTITQTPTNITVTMPGVGIEYGADYSSTFTNRSLVDKEYVDNIGIQGPTGPAGATGPAGGGGGTSSATMFNSVISPMVISGGASPWYKLNTPATSYAGAAYVLVTPDQISYSPINLVAGETINEVAIFCSALVAAATASIALYSISLDANGRHYPSTLLTTFGDVSLASTGRKTITGLSYSIPASPYGIYYTAILRTGAAGSPAIAGPVNTTTIGYYGSLDSLSLQSRSMTIRTGGSTFTFPSTITSAVFSTYNPIAALPYIGFR